MNKTMFRVMLVLVPLLTVAVSSAHEWPARAMMMEGPMRDTVVRSARWWSDATTMVRVQAPANDAPTFVVRNTRAKPPTDTQAAAQNVTEIVADVETATAQVAVAPKPVVLSEGKLLMLGDLLMGEVVAGMRTLLPKNYSFSDRHRASTGLTNDQYYNWRTQAGVFAKENAAQWVFIHLGGNDGQDMMVNGVWHKFGTDGWKQNYLSRAQDMIDQVKTALPNATIVWVGLPKMRPPNYQRKMDVIEPLQKQAALSRHIVYVDGAQSFGAQYQVDGPCLNGSRCVLRMNDGIHYSREGGRVMANTALSLLDNMQR